MLFNHRRQSQDRMLRERVAERSQQAGSRLLMSVYTARQFRDDLPGNALVSTSFLDEAQAGDYCFVEDADPIPYIDRIEQLIIYRWNRDYPRDTLLPFDLAAWCLVSSEDFAGSSHDTITEEIYQRCGAEESPAAENEGRSCAENQAAGRREERCLPALRDSAVFAVPAQNRDSTTPAWSISTAGGGTLPMQKGHAAKAHGS